MRAALVICAALLAAPATAAAHGRGASYSTWIIRGAEIAVEVQIAAVDRNAVAAAAGRAVAGGAATPAGLLMASLHAFDGAGTPCAARPETFAELHAPRGWSRFEWSLGCASPPRRLRVDLLFDLVAGHIHFARLSHPGQKSGMDVVLVPGEREISITGAAARRAGDLATLSRFARLGVLHIVSGWDHLVFLLVLILGATTLGRVLAVATGFTIGHSVTLVLSVLGYASADAGAVEALIALSIALVAVEVVWLTGDAPEPGGRRDRTLPAAAVVACAALALTPVRVPAAALLGVALFAGCYFALLARSRRPDRLRAVVAALFGLVHGFGFAGALRGAMPAGDAVMPLTGFNLGVELGQIAVLAASWPAVALLCRAGHRRALVTGGAVVAMALAAFWFVERA